MYVTKKMYMEMAEAISELSVEVRTLQREIEYMSKWRLVENKCGRW